MQPGQKPWAVVVPVKRLALAKTRLGLPPDVRARLALAMAADTVAACRAAARVRTVVVVTDDPVARSMAAAAGAVVVADEPDAGLNPALHHGASVVGAVDPQLGIATVSSDLAALTGADVDAILALAEASAASSGAVADAAGTGTVLLAATSLAAFAPAFGPDSYARHLAAGADDLTHAAAPRLRRDVDTLADLVDACRLGCGPATAAALADVGGLDRLAST